jgi:hypothetical protein
MTALAGRVLEPISKWMLETPVYFVTVLPTTVGLPIASTALQWQARIAPAGLAGGLFLGLAGIKHAMNAERSTKENVAMTTDLLVACVVAVYLGALAVR